MKIAITGGFGFIGSSFIEFLNAQGVVDIDIYELEDSFRQWSNLNGAKFSNIFTQWNSETEYDCVVHLGAYADPSIKSTKENWNNNAQFSQKILAAKAKNIIIASSAAVYGDTEDFTERNNLRPLNFYAYTKLWIDQKLETHPRAADIYSLRFFNVYGPKEEFKVGHNSPVYKWLTKRVSAKRVLHLYKSTRKMERDFIYIEDVCKVIWHCMQQTGKGGIYNVGTGISTPWTNLCDMVMAARKLPHHDQDGNPNVTVVEMPEALRAAYQYYTCANLDKLRNSLGYSEPFTAIEDGIKKTWEILEKSQ